MILSLALGSFANGGHLASSCDQWDYQFPVKNNSISFSLCCSECSCPLLKPLHWVIDYRRSKWLHTKGLKIMSHSSAYASFFKVFHFNGILYLKLESRSKASNLLNLWEMSTPMIYHCMNRIQIWLVPCQNQQWHMPRVWVVKRSNALHANCSRAAQNTFHNSSLHILDIQFFLAIDENLHSRVDRDLRLWWRIDFTISSTLGSLPTE